MNHERSRNKGIASSNLENNRIVSPKPKVKQFKASHNVNRSIGTHQVTSLNQPLCFWEKHSRWSYFGRGLFWGGIISFIAIFSAGLGVASTKIDAVEKVIAQRIKMTREEVNSFQGRSEVEPSLNSPANLLLIEVKPNDDALLKFSDTVIGKSKTILVLRFEPEQGLAQVINIPPDSRVKMPGYGWGTIADAHRYGGTPLVSSMVNQLMDDITIDHYLRAIPETFQQLTATGKLTFPDCDSRIRDCNNKIEQVARQQTAFKSIRQRLNIVSYLANFKTTVTEVKPNLDTNISVAEIISFANFVKELEPDSITVDLLPGYIPGKTIAVDNRLKNRSLKRQSFAQAEVTSPTVSRQLNEYYLFQKSPIAVQNTTDSPELGRKVVAYLRRQNFQDVYLVEHIPLKLNKTKIVIDQSQLETANYLKNVLGFGSLKSQYSPKQKELTIQIGKDAHYLPWGNRWHNY